MSPWKPLEGETPIDPSGLKNPGAIRDRRELSAAEARNISKAFLKYLASRPRRGSARFDYAWFLELHGEMFAEVWDWAGTPRTHNMNLGVPHHQIAERLAALGEDLQSWTGFGHPFLRQACWLHHRAVEIHPFENGNGRWARLLSNIWLKLHDEPIVAWPDKLMGESSAVRGEYLAAVQSADRGDDSALFELHERFQETR